MIQSVNKQMDVVTCLAVASDYGQHWLVSGSKDCTVVIWTINPDDKETILSPRCVLYGHDGAVCSVSINTELDTIVSGSEDGIILVHGLRSENYIRCLDVKNGDMDNNSVWSPRANSSQLTLSPSVCEHTQIGINWVGISKESVIVAYSAHDQMLRSFSINGQTLSSVFIDDYLHAFCFSQDGSVLLTGGKRGLVVLRWVTNLELASSGCREKLSSVVDGQKGVDYSAVSSSGDSQSYNNSNAEDESNGAFNCAIRSICYSKDEQHLIVGLESGQLRVLSQDPSFLTSKLKDALKGLG